MTKKKLPRAIARDIVSMAAEYPPEKEVGSTFADWPIGIRDQESLPRVTKGQTPHSVAQNGASRSAANYALNAADPLVALRRQIAIRVAERFSYWSGFAGLIPVPVVDLAAVSGVQIQMVRRISEIYEIPFSKNRGKALIVSIAGAIIPATSVVGAMSMAKGLPGIGTAVNTLAMPALTASATYAIGMAFIEHYATGGTLLNFSPPDYRDFIRSRLRLRSARS